MQIPPMAAMYKPRVIIHIIPNLISLSEPQYQHIWVQWTVPQRYGLRNVYLHQNVKGWIEILFSSPFGLPLPKTVLKKRRKWRSDGRQITSRAGSGSCSEMWPCTTLPLMWCCETAALEMCYLI